MKNFLIVLITIAFLGGVNTIAHSADIQVCVTIPDAKVQDVREAYQYFFSSLTTAQDIKLHIKKEFKQRIWNTVKRKRRADDEASYQDDLGLQ